MTKTGPAPTLRAPDGSFASVLIAAREKAGVTRAEMARLLDVSPPSITNFESGDRATYGLREDTIRRYAEALGLEVRLELVPRPKRRARRR